MNWLLFWLYQIKRCTIEIPATNLTKAFFLFALSAIHIILAMKITDIFKPPSALYFHAKGDIYHIGSNRYLSISYASTHMLG